MRYTNKRITMKLEYVKHRINLSPEAAKQAIHDLSGNAYKLFIYFITKSDGFVMNHKHICYALDITEKTAQTAKNELISKEYLHIDHGKRHDHYYVGIEPVKKFKKQYSEEVA